MKLYEISFSPTGGTKKWQIAWQRPCQKTSIPLT